MLLPAPLASLEKTRWYHGSSGTDLIFEHTQHDQLQSVSIYVHGVWVNWNQADGLRTGVTALSEKGGSLELGVMRLQNQTIRVDSAMDHQKLEVAKRLILSSNLSEAYKQWATQNLN